MPGPNLKRLVLLGSTSGTTGKSRVGTGYFITESLVLTASHCVPDEPNVPISVRVEEGVPLWRDDGEVVWRDELLDAALIRVTAPLPPESGNVEWGERIPDENVTWTSTAYPNAAVSNDETGRPARKNAGLQGTLYASGGGGQGHKELDLDVDSPPRMEEWAGVSGAPVFVGATLMGLVKSTGFDGRRFHGTPATALLQNAGFRLAIEPSWLEYPKSDAWLLVLLSEEDARSDFAKTVKGSFERHDELISKALGEPLPTRRIVTVQLNEALETPGRWLQLVQAICAAPLMIADVTGFEAGVMLALGVRSVVRRGVTVASTSHSLNEAQLAELPFNIQETKLISHGDDDPSITGEDHPRYSLNIIANTFLNGIRELKTNPRYLDLPAYDAVRCPPPEHPPDEQRVREAVLVLCSFHTEYANHWRKVLDALAKHYPKKRALRMRDIISPRLVGQTLYEHIRWTTTCVVDWTHWRANVFFELGVRLACAKTEPISLLEDFDPSSLGLRQYEQLVGLFGPKRYVVEDAKTALHQALDVHDREVGSKSGDDAALRPVTRVPINGTYHASLAAFEFVQERAAMAPHEFLRYSNEAMLGTDRQKTGEMSVLYSANAAFGPKLWRSVRERWIAAWLYLRHRYADDELRSNPLLSSELRQLGETLLQEVRNDPGDPFIGALRSQVIDLIDMLDEVEADRGAR